ncbi:MAG: HAD family acid phosphatase [Candidatus Melainabacteria bacterium]|nr:HAD family acid phosphatase [Candidatus Melainabacteria bacterium]
MLDRRHLLPVLLPVPVPGRKVLRSLFCSLGLVMAILLPFAPVWSATGNPLETTSAKTASVLSPCQASKLGLEQTVPALNCSLAETLTLHFRQRLQQVLTEARQAVSQAILSQGTPALAEMPVKPLAVVVDLDETLLDNRAYFAEFGPYQTEAWNTWIARADAPAIAETLDWVRWVKAQGVRVYFVSGRREHQRQATEQNLKAIGLELGAVTPSGYDGLSLKPNDYPPEASPSGFKVEARKVLEARGLRVLLLLGDQASDLAGPVGEHRFQLPNPIYVIP